MSFVFWKRLAVFLCMQFAVVINLYGQEHPAESLAVFESWIGDWDGSGWSIDRDGKRVEFKLVEHVRWRVGNTVVLLDGTAVSKGTESIVLHDGLSIVFVDKQTGKLNWRGYELGRDPWDSPIEILENGVRWQIQSVLPKATVRFTFHVDGKTWKEIGEVSTDGKYWQKIMECQLARTLSTSSDNSPQPNKLKTKPD
ncbi:MAG: hypothetical protein U0930_25270 [Pirellulales bacterium]